MEYKGFRGDLTKENLKSFLKGLGFALIQSTAIYVLAVKDTYGLEDSVLGMLVVSLANLTYQFYRKDK
jgi:hypothetical protein